MSAGLGLRPFAQKGLCPSGAALRRQGYPERSAYAEVRSSIGHRGHAAARRQRSARRRVRKSQAVRERCCLFARLRVLRHGSSRAPVKVPLCAGADAAASVAAAATARPGTTVGRPRREVGRSRGWPRGEPACRVRVVLFVFPGLPSTPGLLGVTRCRARSGHLRRAVAVPGLRPPRTATAACVGESFGEFQAAPVTGLEDASDTDHR